MATDKHTVSIYVDQDLLEKLNEFKTNGEYKSLNVALNSFLRESFLGEVSGNVQSKVQSTVQSTLDIKTMIDDALDSKIKELREEFEEHEAIMVSRSQKTFEVQIATFREEMNEAIATAKKPLLSVMREKVIAA